MTRDGRGGRVATVAVCGLCTVALPLLGASAQAQAAATAPTTPAATTPATTPAPTTTVPGTTPADAAVVAQAQQQVNAPLPPIPAVDRQYTDNVDPAVLLARAFALLQAGSKTASLNESLSGLQASMVASTFQANQAAQQAKAADADATHQALMAQELSSDATSLDGALKDATLSLYMTGRPTSLPMVHSGDADAVVDAMVGEQVALSPDGLLAAKKKAAAEAQSAAQQAQSSQAVADAQAAQEQTSQSAVTSEVGTMQDELASIGGSDAHNLQSETATLTQQAGQDLTSGTSLEFTPTQPIPPPVATTEAALTWAFSELGKPYVWGGTGPDDFDCSGLTQYSWAHAGVAIPRVAIDQYGYTIPVPLSQLRPGDLVYFGTDVHHVGMYIGGGLMINAPHTGTVVQIAPMWWSDLIGFGRVHAPGVPVPAHSIANGSPADVVGSLGVVPSQTGSDPNTVRGATPTTTTPPATATPTTSPTTPTVPSAPTTPTTVPSTTSTTVPETTSTTTKPGL